MKTTTRKINQEITDAMLCILAENLTWQTNLNDAEREQCIAWATARLESTLSQGYTGVLGQLRTVNVLLGQNEICRSDVIRAVLGTGAV